MYCNKCGNKIKEGSKFCDKCDEKVETCKESIEGLNEGKIDNNKYMLTKRKMLGNITTSMYYSDIEIKDNNIIVQQYKKYLNIIKGGEKNINIKIDEIQSIVIQKKFDTIDLIYAIIFAIIAACSMQLYLLIITAVCLWTGYGDRISVLKKNGEKVIIQSEVCDESKRFINIINSMYLDKKVNIETNNVYHNI